MEPDHIPNPQRFEVFTQLSSGKGFRIKNSRYIYLFDKNRGWYDEYNNYYNCDGQPEDAPSDEDDDFQKVILEEDFQEVDDDDQFEREYGGTGHGIHDDYETHHSYNSQQQKILQAIANNQAILIEYPVKTPLRIDFENLSFKANKHQILKHFRQKVGNGILNVIVTLTNGKFIGEGYFVCKDVSVGQKLIKYEGEQFLGRKVYFDVESVEENLIQPVTKQQMDITINQDEFESLVKEKPIDKQSQEIINAKKKYFAKGKATQQKKQQPNNKVTQQQKSKTLKQQVKTQIKSTQQKLQQPKKQENKVSIWSKYLGDVTMFPKKTSFKDWMNSLGFKENEHFKNPEKAESKDINKRFATVQLRSDVYNKIEGAFYEKVRIHFDRIN